MELAKKYFQEATRYLRNGKEILQKLKIEYKNYTDAKPVAQACALGYLAVLKALDGYLLLRGMQVNKLPDTFQGYWTTLTQVLSHNGKIKFNLKRAYDVLHVRGYYRAGTDVEIIKSGFQAAKFIIETLSKQ